LKQPVVIVLLTAHSDAQSRHTDRAQSHTKRNDIIAGLPRFARNDDPKALFC